MHQAVPRVLFVVKRRTQDYGQGSSSGVSNAALMTASALEQCGIAEAAVHVVADGNAIEAAAVTYRATVVIVEALWATPAKMAQLARLHPEIDWYVRVHSRAPFLAVEGFATGWLAAYAASMANLRNLHIAANSYGMCDDLSTVLSVQVDYLPVIYQVTDQLPAPATVTALRFGSFGALRALKNTYEQAVAAIIYATNRRLVLEFNVNATPDDMASNPIYANVAALFAAQAVHGHKLVVNPWMPHAAFLGLVREMDVVMQVSFSESFNIVAADAVSQGVPVVVGTDVDWLPEAVRVSPTSTSAIIRGIVAAMGDGADRFTDASRLALARYIQAARVAWSVVL